jgi:hypothetical protein
VILAPGEYQQWFEGSVDNVIEFQFRRAFPAEKMALERTKELWVQRPRAAHGALL